MNTNLDEKLYGTFSQAEKSNNKRLRLQHFAELSDGTHDHIMRAASVADISYDHLGIPDGTKDALVASLVLPASLEEGKERGEVLGLGEVSRPHDVYDGIQQRGGTVNLGLGETG